MALHPHVARDGSCRPSLILGPSAGVTHGQQDHSAHPVAAQARGGPTPAPVEPAPAAGGLPSTEELLRAGLKAFRLENLLGLGQHAKAPRAEAPAPGLGFPSLDSFGFRKFEDVFDQRVAGALQRLGWPTADDVAALHAEIEQLKAEAAALRQAPASRASAAAKPAARRPRAKA